VSLPYPLVCTLIGLVLGWVPRLLHGPIPYKFDMLGIRGALAVWAFYSARLLIGFVVGITRWPRPWWVRGPLCGIIVMFPLGLFLLATPGCGGSCTFWNMTSATLIGTVTAGLAWLVTGKNHL
jgi:hypothetical protein